MREWLLANAFLCAHTAGLPVTRNLILIYWHSNDAHCCTAIVPKNSERLSKGQLYCVVAVIPHTSQSRRSILLHASMVLPSVSHVNWIHNPVVVKYWNVKFGLVFE